jgi:putative membrane protein
MNHMHKSLSVLGLALAVAVTVRAQVPSDALPPPAPSSMDDSAMDGKITHGEKSFLLAVAEGSNQEIALSQLALTNASSQAVKDFAQMMLHDHAMLNAQLNDLAASKGVDLTDAVAKGMKKGVKRLEKKQGADFDEAYLKDMVSGHDATLKAFAKQAEKAKDPDIQAFASKNLPTIQMHDDHAHSLAQASM